MLLKPMLLRYSCDTVGLGASSSVQLGLGLETAQLAPYQTLSLRERLHTPRGLQRASEEARDLLVSASLHCVQAPGMPPWQAAVRWCQRLVQVSCRAEF